MLFMTIVFLCYYSMLLYKGSLLGDKIIKVAELEIEKESEIRKYKKDEIMMEQFKILLPLYFMFALVIIETIFLTRLIKIDIYTYPTILMILHTIYGFAKSFGKNTKHDINTEKGREDYLNQAIKESKRNAKFTITTILNIVYFGYIFYLLIL